MQASIARYDAGDNAALLAQMQAAIASEQTDVLHDLLAHLAQRMIDLNKQKQAEVKRFLGWLEDRLKLKPAKDGAAGIGSLSGTQKRAFAEYLGDYQKGQAQLVFQSQVNEDDFSYFLHKNRSRFGVPLSDASGAIEREYERSLKKSSPSAALASSSRAANLRCAHSSVARFRRRPAAFLGMPALSRCTLSTISKLAWPIF